MNKNELEMSNQNTTEAEAVSEFKPLLCKQKIKVLNLYAGIGGNRKLWEGVDVTAVEINPDIAHIYADQFPNDNLIVGDAHQYLLDHHDKFDFVWSSPPCQSHSRMVKATRHDVRKYPDMSLYQEVVFLDNFFNGKWVIENVKPYYDPLIAPTKTIGRHIFWANFKIGSFNPPKIENFIMQGGVNGAERLKEWLGIHYEGNIYYDGNHEPSQVLRNCVHPETGLYILNRALEIKTKTKTEQRSLFA